jgi:hypothetical protein
MWGEVRYRASPRNTAARASNGRGAPVLSPGAAGQNRPNEARAHSSGESSPRDCSMTGRACDPLRAECQVRALPTLKTAATSPYSGSGTHDGGGSHVGRRTPTAATYPYGGPLTPAGVHRS